MLCPLLFGGEYLVVLLLECLNQIDRRHAFIPNIVGYVIELFLTHTKLGAHYMFEECHRKGARQAVYILCDCFESATANASPSVYMFTVRSYEQKSPSLQPISNISFTASPRTFGVDILCFVRSDSIFDTL